MYDIGAADTFRSLPEWLEEIQRYSGKQVHRFLIGNKSDRLGREVQTQTGEEFAKQNGMPFLETSAKNASNIDQLFSQLAKVLKNLHVEEKLQTPYYSGAGVKPNTVTLSRAVKKGGASGKACCS